MMTGEPTVETAAHAVRKGAVDYLVKPIGKLEIIKAVRNALRLKSVDDERRRLEQENLRYQADLEALVLARTSELKETTDQLQQTIGGTIRAIAGIVEARDPYTAGHQQRVSTLADTIAEEMSLSDVQRRGIQLSSLLHDLGKISVPAEILAKPGRLTDAEFTIVKAHAEIGADILRNISFPWPVAEIVLQHHERLDGTGYPRGIAGDAIIIEARIIAVADVVEAMSAHRPYRPALGIQAALEEIDSSRGQRYDDAVVSACTRVIETDRVRLVGPVH
jgi:putative nucleotidyltransferase with HDIG domain